LLLRFTSAPLAFSSCMQTPRAGSGRVCQDASTAVHSLRLPRPIVQNILV
jgi:hypothetical protein